MKVLLISRKILKADVEVLDQENIQTDPLPKYKEGEVVTIGKKSYMFREGQLKEILDEYNADHDTVVSDSDHNTDQIADYRSEVISFATLKHADYDEEF